jgi:hypothetical protein
LGKVLGVAVVGSSSAGLLDYKALRCRWPAALLIGSEKRGLSGHLAEIADFMVRIPILSEIAATSFPQLCAGDSCGASQSASARQQLATRTNALVASPHVVIQRGSALVETAKFRTFQFSRWEVAPVQSSSRRRLLHL